MRIIDADKFLEDMKSTDRYFMVKFDIERAPTVDLWHYPSKGELPEKDWTKYPANVSKECFVLTERGIGTIARWDNDYKTWFEKPHDFAVTKVIAWQYFVPPNKEKI